MINDLASGLKFFPHRTLLIKDTISGLKLCSNGFELLFEWDFNSEECYQEIEVLPR